MARFYYGLNVNFNFSEIVDEELALQNLGLRRTDLDLISGAFNEGVTSGDIIALSSADFDIKKIYDSVDVALSKYVTLLNGIKTISETLQTNIVIDNQFKARSIKFDYYDYYNSTTRSADISTSRISSWSSFDEFDETAPIFYKGDLEITPNPVVGNVSVLDITSLTTTVEPTPKRFKAEVPTHLISINVNGSIENFLAMKGIPLKFKATAETLTSGTSGNIDHRTINGAGDPPPTWTITNLDDNLFLPFEDVRNIGGLGLTYFGNGTANLLIEFYNDPRKIDLLKLRNMSLYEFTKSQISGLTELYIDSNQLPELPDLRYTAPVLEILDASVNPFSRSNLSAGQQLARLPATIKRLTLKNCFSDTSTIDLSQNVDSDSLTSLERFYFYGNSPSARMRSGGPTPKIYVDPVSDENTSMEIYDIRYQDYDYLDESVMKAKNITDLLLYSNTSKPISAGWNGSEEIDVYLSAAGDGGADTGRLKTYVSYYNTHNLVNVSGCQSITTYNHQYARSIRGSSSIVGIFSGCGSLQSINLTSTKVTGEINIAFKNLPSLSSLTLYNTSLSGVMDANTFEGTPLLSSFSISSNQLGSATEAFFDSLVFAQTVNIRSINISGNKNIRGSLPNFNSNKSLSTINISNTSLDSNLTNLAEIPAASYIALSSNEFTGSAPEFNNSRVSYLIMNNNKFNGNLPTPNTPNLYYLQMSNNSFIGNMPSFSGCPRIRYVYLQNNTFTGYQAGSISSCTNLRYYYVNNNQLTVDDAANILRDVYQIHIATQGSTTTRRFDLRNNNFTLNDLLTYEPDIQSIYDTITLIRRWQFQV